MSTSDLQRESESGGGVWAELVSLECWPTESRPGKPIDRQFFCYTVQAFIGVRDDPGSASSFDWEVVSPLWFAREWQSGSIDANVFQIWDKHANIVPGHSFWFMAEWDQAQVEAAIRLICFRSSPAPDRRTLNLRIGRHLPWEWAGIDDERQNRGAGLPMPDHPSRD